MYSRIEQSPAFADRASHARKHASMLGGKPAPITNYGAHVTPITR